MTVMSIISFVIGILFILLVGWVRDLDDDDYSSELTIFGKVVMLAAVLAVVWPPFYWIMGV